MILLLGSALALAGVAGAAVVANTNVMLDDGAAGAADYALTVFQDETGTDPTTMWFDLSGDTLSLVMINLDEASDWYQVTGSDVFSAASIIGGTHPVQG